MFDPFQDERRMPRAGRDYVPSGQVGMDLSGEMPATAYIPGGTMGGKSVGKGTVIPRHRPGRGGANVGYDPHKPPHKNVVVDPHIAGRAVALDLQRITPESATEAFELGKQFIRESFYDLPEKMDNIDTTEHEQVRVRAYVAARALADQFGAASDPAFGPVAGRQARVIQAAPGGEAFVPIPAPPNGRRPPPDPARHDGPDPAASTLGGTTGPVQVVSGDSVPRPVATGPMARFRPAPVAPTAHAPAAAPALHVMPGTAAAGPPTRRVTFDFGDPIGQFPAQYHAVHYAERGIYLAWDTRWPHGEPYSPEKLVQQFAMQVQGDDRAYLVMSLGDFTFVDDRGMRYYVLGVVESTPNTEVGSNADRGQ